MSDAPKARVFNPAATHPRPEPPAHLPGLQPQGFTPVEDLLKEMGLARPKAEAPFIAPLSPKQAEFSPPRPLRRAPVRFARPDENGGKG